MTLSNAGWTLCISRNLELILGEKQYCHSCDFQLTSAHNTVTLFSKLIFIKPYTVLSKYKLLQSACICCIHSQIPGVQLLYIHCIFWALHISFYNYQSSFSLPCTCLNCYSDIFPSCSIIVQNCYLLSHYKCTLQDKMWRIMNVYTFFLLCTSNSPLHLSQLSSTLFWKTDNAIFIQLVKGCSGTDGSFPCLCLSQDLTISLLIITPRLYENMVCISHFHMVTQMFHLILWSLSYSSLQKITFIFNNIMENTLLL
jgi:hypothetical protein